MKHNTIRYKALHLLVSGLLGLVLVSCSTTGSVPPLAERGGAAPASLAEAPGGEAAGQEAAPAEGMLKALEGPEVITHTVPISGQAPEASESQSALETAAEEMAARPEPTLRADDLSYDSLLESLKQRITEDWEGLRGGLGVSPAGEEDTRKKLAAARLIALTFLLDDQQMDPTLVREAIASVTAEQGPAEYHLLAAACLLREGAPEEGLEVASQAFEADALAAKLAETGSDPSDPEEEDGGRVGRFHLGNVSFATDIKGLGHWVAAQANDLRPGKKVLVYGEFRNAQSVENEQEPGTVRQDFSAHLELLRADGRRVDRLQFLPEGLGTHVTTRPGEPVNFWARYTIPDTLQPGEYRVMIYATDLVGESSSVSELKLSVE